MDGLSWIGIQTDFERFVSERILSTVITFSGGGHMDFNHGGDIAGFQMKYGRKPLDFSANVSPFGVSDSVRLAAAEALTDCDVYPDPFCRELRAALAEKYRILPEHILCGNGASDLIYRLAEALRPKKAMIPVPTFSEYEAALALAGCCVEHFHLREEDDFLVTEDILEAILPDTDILFLCQPNNPTGRVIPRALMLKILERCDETGTIVAMDECFIDFLPDSEKISLIGERRKHRIIVFRAFTKFWGLAGLRLGWCICADQSLLERMRISGQPWPVSGVAQAAGIAALKDTEALQNLRAMIGEQRVQLMNQLEACGLRVIPGEANFLLFYGDENLGEKLAAKGILIRDCRDFCGLSAGWFRTAVRTEKENDLLINAIKEILENE